MKKKLIIGISFIVIFIIISSVLFNKVNDKKLTKVKVAEVAHSIFYTPMYVADSLGYFDDFGLDVDIIGDTTDTVEANSYLDGDGKRHIEAEVRLQGGGDDVLVDDGNALGVIGNEGLYLSKTWNCGEYSESESEDVSDDESYMNYQRLS